MKSLFGERSPTPTRRKKPGSKRYQPPQRERPSFMKYSTKQDSSTMDRTREHAKMLASQLAPATPVSFAGPSATTVDPASFAGFADFDRAFGATAGTPKEQLSPGISRRSQTSFFHDDPFSPSSGPKDTISSPSFAVSWPDESQTMKSMTKNSTMQKSYATQQQQRNSVVMSPSPQFPSPQQPRSSSRRRQRMMVSDDHSNSSSTSNSQYQHRSMKAPLDQATSTATRNINRPRMPQNHRSGSSVSSGHSATSHSNSITNRSMDESSVSVNSDANLFDSSVDAGGFSFDAFGLDASQINREVSLALKDIRGNAGSNKDLSYYMDQDPGDDFASNHWDSSPNNSRSGTPVQESPKQDGFVDGFRVKSLGAKNSPGSTEQTSMTSESSAGRRNLFKERAGFASVVVPSLDNDSPPKRKEDVEFYDSDDQDVDVETEKSGFGYSDHGAQSEGAFSSDVGVSSDVGLTSDVGASSDAGVAFVEKDYVPMEITSKRMAPRYSIQSNAATIRSSPRAAHEEKKDDEPTESRSLSVGNLRSRWEVSGKQTAVAQKAREITAKSNTSTPDSDIEYYRSQVKSAITKIRNSTRVPSMNENGAPKSPLQPRIRDIGSSAQKEGEKLADPMSSHERRELERQTEKETEKILQRESVQGLAHKTSQGENIQALAQTTASAEVMDQNSRSSTPSRPSLDIETRSDLVIESSPIADRSIQKKQASAAVARLLELQKTDQNSPTKASESVVSGEAPQEESPQKASTPKATMIMLNAFLAGRDKCASLNHKKGDDIMFEVDEQSKQGSSQTGGPHTVEGTIGSLPALKNDPKYEKYFRMLKVGMPMEAVKHAMVRDGLDPSVMDGDHNKAVGLPLKDDPLYQKYFKMLKLGLPLDAVQHAMKRDGLDPSVMDQDHSLPVGQGKKKTSDESTEKDSHRRARLHWNTLRKVTSNSLWAKIDQDDMLSQIQIDETEFQELFQLEKDAEPSCSVGKKEKNAKKGPTVRVIDPKRANNGGIVLARLKLSYDEMADAVDRINEKVMNSEQLENIIEYLPTAEEKKKLESYMLEGGHDAAEKFTSLSECEKFMVSMMTVKHAKRKVRALLFRLQFGSCVDEILRESSLVEKACDELSNSVRLRQLLGIILTFGNRLNTAGKGTKRRAGAFTLDSLLKLNQAKAFDKKTTFLQYIVMIVQRNNELLLNFKDDLPTVFEADKVYWDQCQADLEEVENQLENVRRIALYQARQSRSYRLKLKRRKQKATDDESLSDDANVELSLEEEVEALRATHIGLFTLSAIKYVSSLREKVEQTKVKFACLLEYFGEDEKRTQTHELFNTIATFARDFEKAKEHVFTEQKKKKREERKRQVNKDIDGRPPTHSGHSKPALPKASNHQPSMSSVLKEMKERASLSAAKSPVDIPVNAKTKSETATPHNTVASAKSSFEKPPSPVSPSRVPPPRSPARKTEERPLSAYERAIQKQSSSRSTATSPNRPSIQVASTTATASSSSNTQNGVTSSTMAAMRQKARIRRQRQAELAPTGN